MLEFGHEINIIATIAVDDYAIADQCPCKRHTVDKLWARELSECQCVNE